MARVSPVSIGVARLIALPVRFYRAAISPWLPKACRYDPSCSRYALDALEEHGVAGVWLAAKRIARCHPWGGFGVDPVPRRMAKTVTR